MENPRTIKASRRAVVITLATVLVGLSLWKPMRRAWRMLVSILGGDLRALSYDEYSQLIDQSIIKLEGAKRIDHAQRLQRDTGAVFVRCEIDRADESRALAHREAKSKARNETVRRNVQLTDAATQFINDQTPEWWTPPDASDPIIESTRFDDDIYHQELWIFDPRSGQLWIVAFAQG